LVSQNPQNIRENRLGKRKREKKTISINNHSGEHPFAATLDEFIKHQSNIIQNKPANIKAKKLCSMSRTQLQANKGWRGMLQTWIFHLLSDLI